jgi:predicted kinase
MTALLVVFGGLPGTGKTSISRQVAVELGATLLRVDSIEAAIKRAGLPLGESPAGYTVAHAVAADQLRADRAVVVDAVNPVRIARAGWEQLAAELDARLRFVRVAVPDVDEHRRRVQSRSSDIAGHVVPTWDAVAAAVHDPWTEPHLELDNSSSLEAAVASVLTWLATQLR